MQRMIATITIEFTTATAAEAGNVSHALSQLTRELGARYEGASLRVQAEEGGLPAPASAISLGAGGLPGSA